MLKYDPAKMVERAKGCLANKKEIIEVADKLSQEGFSNIFFIGVGGTITYAWSIQETLKPLTTLEYHAEHAADFNTLGNKKFTKDSIVFGYRPSNALCAELSLAGVPFTAIGDCRRVGKVLDAMHEAYTAAYNL